MDKKTFSMKKKTNVYPGKAKTEKKIIVENKSKAKSVSVKKATMGSGLGNGSYTRRPDKKRAT